ncbi:hypothetical protein CEP51_009173 [Fusarium floridanum]|uniref:Uncharacterized protein n=1 Tax=Fusarium floridanum TaxID=1325733 RepID=A0A428RIJ2_9HYPO|nr:hypothetical protein CEP51_009173 [Fusarium floridanum]
MLSTSTECVQFREAAIALNNSAIEFPERYFRVLQEVGAMKMPGGLSSGGVIHTYLTLSWCQALSDLFYTAQLKYSQLQSGHPDGPKQEISFYLTEYITRDGKIAKKRYIQIELLNLQRLAELCAHGLYGEKSGSELARTTIEFLKLCEPDDSAFHRAKLENQWFLLGNYYD